MSRLLAMLALLTAGASCKVSDVELGGPVSTSAAPPIPISGACGSTPSTLAQIDNLLPQPMGMDNENLYVVAFETATDQLHATIWQVPKTGGAPRAVATDQPGIGGLAVADGVYWTTVSPGTVVGGAVWTINELGIPVALAENRPMPGAVIVVGDRVYWAEQAAGSQPGAVMWTGSKQGGAVNTLQTTPSGAVPHGFVSDGTTLYWTTADPLFADYVNAELVAAPLPLPFEKTTDVSSPSTGGVSAITLGGGDEPSYLIYGGPTGILASPLAMGPRRFIPTNGYVQSIASQDGYVYFIDPGTSKLSAAAPAPASSFVAQPSTLVDDVDPAGAIRVDSTCVYFLDATSGAVMMVHE